MPLGEANELMHTNRRRALSFGWREKIEGPIHYLHLVPAAVGDQRRSH